MKILVVVAVVLAAALGSGCVECDFITEGICVQLPERARGWDNIEGRVKQVIDTGIAYCNEGFNWTTPGWILEFTEADITCFGLLANGCTNPLTRRIRVQIDADDCIEDEVTIHEICHAMGHISEDGYIFRMDNICSLLPEQIAQHPSCAPVEPLTSSSTAAELATWDHRWGGPGHACGWGVF